MKPFYKSVEIFMKNSLVICLRNLRNGKPPPPAAAHSRTTSLRRSMACTHAQLAKRPRALQKGCTAGLLLSLLISLPALACTDNPPISAVLANGGFHVTEVAKSHGDYYLRLEKLVTSTVDLSAKAEQRSRALCGGVEFRYLAVLESVENAPSSNEPAGNRAILEIELDCMADGQDE